MCCNSHTVHTVRLWGCRGQRHVVMKMWSFPMKAIKTLVQVGIICKSNWMSVATSVIWAQMSLVSPLPGGHQRNGTVVATPSPDACYSWLLRGHWQTVSTKSFTEGSDALVDCKSHLQYTYKTFFPALLPCQRSMDSNDKIGLQLDLG